MMKRKLGNFECLGHRVLLSAVDMFVYAVFFQPRPASLGPVTGSKLSGIADVVGNSETETLELAISPTCPQCLVSRGFYKEIVDRRNHSSQGLQFMAVVNSSVSIALPNRALKEEKVVPDAVLAIPFGENGIFDAPSVMTLDGNWVIGDVWMGRLDLLQVATVLSAIGLKLSVSL